MYGEKKLFFFLWKAIIFSARILSCIQPTHALEERSTLYTSNRSVTMQPSFFFIYFLPPPSTSFIPFLLEVRVNICSSFMKSSFFIVSSLVVSISDINFSVSSSSLLYLTLIFRSHCFTGTLFKLFLLLLFLFLCSIFLPYCDV